MFAPATGTVLLLTVVPTTLLAAQAASSVVLSRMTWLEATTVLTSCAPELLVAVEDLDGNLVIGYAPGDSVIHLILCLTIRGHLLCFFLCLLSLKCKEYDKHHKNKRHYCWC